MKKMMIMLVVLLAIGFQSSYAVTEKKTTVTITRSDGDIWGFIWHLVDDGYRIVRKSTVETATEINTDINCSGGGTQICPNSLVNVPVPDDFPQNAVYDRDKEVQLHFLNAEATGEINSLIYTSQGNKYTFNTVWHAENCRNNKIVTTIQLLP